MPARLFSLTVKRLLTFSLSKEEEAEGEEAKMVGIVEVVGAKMVEVAESKNYVPVQSSVHVQT